MFRFLKPELAPVCSTSVKLYRDLVSCSDQWLQIRQKPLDQKLLLSLLIKIFSRSSDRCFWPIRNRSDQSDQGWSRVRVWLAEATPWIWLIGFSEVLHALGVDKRSRIPWLEANLDVWSARSIVSAQVTTFLPGKY